MRGDDEDAPKESTMRITRPVRKTAAVATLGRKEIPIQSDAGGPAVHDARAKMMRTIREWMKAHPDVASIQIVASARYGGYTVDELLRSDLF